MEDDARHSVTTPVVFTPSPVEQNKTRWMALLPRLNEFISLVVGVND
jgi:hypothetical protein